MPQYLIPDWPAPNNVKAYTTLRTGGFSKKPFDSFNLGIYVGDDPQDVQANRNLLKKDLQLPAEPLWIKQVHGIGVAEHKDVSVNKTDTENKNNLNEADASVAFHPNQVCIVLTADCLPILICDKKGTRVSAVHAGWRSLSGGVIEEAINKLKIDPKELLIWLGPAIGPESFEVGEDVLNAFDVDLNDFKLNKSNDNIDSNKLKLIGFKVTGNSKYLANIYQLAKLRLKKLGISEQSIFGGEYCTYKEKEKFYSFRRDKETGRMASLIWLE